MKTLFNCLNYMLFLSITLLSVSVNSQPILNECVHLVNLAPDAIGASPNGEVFTPKGDLKVLTIFAGFDDGTAPGSFDEDQFLPGWSDPQSGLPTTIPTALMANPDNWMYDNIGSFGNNTYNLSEYYYHMSGGQFRMYGDILKNGLNQVVRIDIDPTSNNPNFPTNASSFFHCNSRVLFKMQQMFPSFNWSQYDQRKNNPNFQTDNSGFFQDMQPDYVVIIYRYSNKWASQPVLGATGWPGAGGGVSVIYQSPGVNYNGYTFTSGFTMGNGADIPSNKMQLFIHEVAHELHSCPHQSGVNGTIGNHWNFASSGYGMITNTVKINQTANGWDRWMLGWIDLTSGYIPQDNTDLQSSANLNATGDYILRDFVTTGDVIRIKIPNSTDQYLWIENHQSKSIFDFKPWAGQDPSPNGEKIPEMSKGIYMYKESIHGNRQSVNTSLSTANTSVNGIKLLNANGNFDYDRSQYGVLNPLWYWGNAIFNFKRAIDNPIEGNSNYQSYPDDYPDLVVSGGSNGAITYAGDYNSGSSEAYPIIRENDGINDVTTYAHSGGVNFEAANFLNRRTDAFIPGDEVSLSGIVPAFNYPIYSTGAAKKAPYYINGLSVKVIGENIITGDMIVHIDFDDYEVRVSKNWAGNLILPPNPNNSALYSLNVMSNVGLAINKSGTANRHTLNTANTPNDFVNNTELVCESGSYFHVESNGIVAVGGSSTVTLKTGSKLELENGAILLIHDAELIIEDGAELILHDGAKLIIDPNGTLTYYNKTPGMGIIVGDNAPTTNQAEVRISGKLVFGPAAIWEHKGAGYYNFHAGHTLNLPSSVPITFKGLGKTVKNLELQQSVVLSISGNVVNWSDGLIQYGYGSSVVMNNQTDFRGTSLTFNSQLTSFPSSIGLDIDDPKLLIVSSSDFNYFDKGVMVSNANPTLILAANKYNNNTTSIDLDNVKTVHVAGSYMSGTHEGVNARNGGIIRITGTEIQGFVNGALFVDIQGAYFENSNVNLNTIGVKATNTLVFVRYGSEIHQNTIGVDIVGIYDYNTLNYSSMLTVGDVDCGSIYNNFNTGVHGRDVLLNIDAEQHAINRGDPNSVVPNRFDNNPSYAFDICYSDMTVAPSQVPALGNYWGTQTGNILPSNYRIKTNTDCINKPNLGNDISLITTSFSTCTPVFSCSDCITSPGSGTSNPPGPPSQAAQNIINAFQNANAPFLVEDKILTRFGFTDLSGVGLLKDTLDSSWTAISVNNEVIPIEAESVNRIQVAKAIKAAGNPNARVSHLANDIFAGLKSKKTQTDNFSLFPNPASDVLNINMNNEEEVSYIIHNIIGEEIQKGFFQKTIQLETDKLNGVYFIEIIGESGVKQVKRFVVNR